MRGGTEGAALFRNLTNFLAANPRVFDQAALNCFLKKAGENEYMSYTNCESTREGGRFFINTR